MTNYRVVWEIDIEAESPEAAAREARKIQRDPESDATVFDVFETNQGEVFMSLKTTVDLTALDNPEGERGFP